MSFRRLSSLLLSAVAAISAIASPQPGGAPDAVPVERPVTSAYTVELGSSRITDTYLSPLKYHGWSSALTYERMQAMKFNPERWVMRLTAGVDLARTFNPSRNASIWGAGVNASWGMTHRWDMSAFLPRLTLAVGGSADIYAGALYCTRNGNNPVAAKASTTVDITGYAAYSFSIGRLPVTLRYQPTLPVAGAFFSPDYGELYYEIYLGNRSGLIHAAWWGTYFRLDNLVTADLHLGGTSLRIGYSGSILSTKVNDIVTRDITHRAVIGLSAEWLTLNPRRPLSPAARIISALY